MESLRTLLNDARAWLERLSARERRLLAMLGGALLLFVVFLTLYGFHTSAQGYRRRTQDKLAQLSDVQTLATSYREAQTQRQAVEQQLSASNVRLISYIEEKATGAGLPVPTMTPKGEVSLGEGNIVESAVEATFTDVTLPRLVEFLQTVESGPGVVRVKYLRLEPRRTPDSQTLTAWTTVATYRMKQ